MSFGRCKYENNMCWRFFECFEQGIKSLSREHVYFVDNINLALALRSRISHLFAQLPDFINPAIRSSVNLQYIHAVALANGNTRCTFPTRFSRWPLLAIECHGKQSRRRGLTRSSRPGEQIRLRHAPQPDGVLQCGGHMALCNHCLKCLWPPLSGHYRVRHKNSKGAFPTPAPNLKKRSCTALRTAIPGRSTSAGSCQVPLRHTHQFAYRCYLPVLTGFGIGTLRRT